MSSIISAPDSAEFIEDEAVQLLGPSRSVTCLHCLEEVKTCVGEENVSCTSCGAKVVVENEAEQSAGGRQGSALRLVVNDVHRTPEPLQKRAAPQLTCLEGVALQSAVPLTATGNDHGSFADASWDAGADLKKLLSWRSSWCLRIYLGLALCAGVAIFSLLYRQFAQSEIPLSSVPVSPQVHPDSLGVSDHQMDQFWQQLALQPVSTTQMEGLAAINALEFSGLQAQFAQSPRVSSAFRVWSAYRLAQGYGDPHKALWLRRWYRRVRRASLRDADVRDIRWSVAQFLHPSNDKRQSLDVDATSSAIRLYVTAQAIADSDARQALVWLERLLSREPNMLDAYLLKAKVLLQLSGTESEANVLAALGRRVDEATTMRIVAILAHSGFIEQAIDLLQNMDIGRLPRHLQVRARTYAVAAALWKGDVHVGVRRAINGVVSGRDWPHTAVTSARLQIFLGADPAIVLRPLQRGAKFIAWRARMIAEQIRAYVLQGNLKAASQSLKPLRRIRGQHVAHWQRYGRGLIQAARGNERQARRSFRFAAKMLDAGDSALALMQQRHAPNPRALRQAPWVANDPDGLFASARAFLIAGESSSARQKLYQLLWEYPGWIEPTRIRSALRDAGVRVPKIDGSEKEKVTGISLGELLMGSQKLASMKL
ncbi:MAG: hypothetical protein R3C68_10310 [Myxococcota bacterium]